MTLNKLLVVVFDNETAADAGLKALRALHAAGDLTLYASGVIVRDAQGVVSVRKPLDPAPSGTATGLAVGSLIGLLGGPVGLAVGAVAGTVVGAIRDFWAAGVGLDFIDEAGKMLLPGKVALLAEVEEEWVVPVDLALEAAGGHVFRRSRSELAEAQFDHDITVARAEIEALDDEARHAAGAASAQLAARLAAAKVRLDTAVQHAQQRVDALKQEADAKASALQLQLSQAQGDAQDRIAHRMKRVTSGYHARGAKLSRAWTLTKEALTA